MKTETILLIIVSMLLISACSSPDKPESTTRSESDHVDILFQRHGTLTMSRDGDIFNEITIEIADNDSTRTRGLMQRDGLPVDSGMLFFFPTESEQGFWMANTRIALDLIFITADHRVLSIAKYVQPMKTETVPSRGLAMYVLEVEAGYTDSIGLIEGDFLEWERD